MSPFMSFALRARWAPRSVASVMLAGGASVWYSSREQRLFVACRSSQQEESSNKTNLLFGIPKKGPLADAVSKMLAGAGVEYTKKERLDIAHCKSLPVSIVFLPAADIATYVADGNVDMGITDEGVVAENEVEVDVLMKLGIGKCSLSVQAPSSGEKMDVRSFAGKRIATAFPNVTRKFFKELEEPGQETQIKVITGSVQATCGLGLADGIVHLVQNGKKLKANDFDEVAVVMKSEGVLIANPNTQFPEIVEILRGRIAGYMVAQSWLTVSYHVHRSNLPTACEITPGKRSPAVQALEEKDWVSVQAMVSKTNAASTMDKLQTIGATDILLTPILTVRD